MKQERLDVIFHHGVSDEEEVLEASVLEDVVNLGRVVIP